MRNWYKDCNCIPDGYPIVGEIINGKKYNDKYVSWDTYNKDITAMKETLEALNSDNTELKKSVSKLLADCSVLDKRVKALEDSGETKKDKYYIYWGASSKLALTEEEIKTLAFNVLTDEPYRTITVQCQNEYVYYVLPVVMGAVQFEVSNFTGGFENPVEVAVLDAEGETIMYNVYRSTRLLNGTAPIKVKR